MGRRWEGRRRIRIAKEDGKRDGERTLSTVVAMVAVARCDALERLAYHVSQN